MPKELRFDVVVLGAGTAGCVLAARLSEDAGRRVALVEAGGAAAPRHPLVRMPAANGFVFGHRRLDWGFRTEPQERLDGRTLYWPRGRGLGGTSLLYGMVYVRGNPRDYDGWRDRGLAGWGHSDVLPYFKRAEGSFRPADRHHGTDGPLRTSPPGNFGRLDELFLEAAQGTGLPPNPDFNGERQIGAGRFDLNVDRGRRVDAASAYLEPARGRPNLRLLTGCRALRVVLERGRAVGVDVLRRGRPCRLGATDQVVVALGAVGTPQLLLLSGIGPAGPLRRLGIPVAADLPGVGADLQDHLQLPIQFACADPSLTLDRLRRPDRAAWVGLRYLLTRRGPGAAPFWSTGAFAALEPGAEHPDLQLFFTPVCVVEDPAADHRKRAAAGFQVDVSLLRPAARGTVRLRSADPLDRPAIDPRYLAAGDDARRLIAGVRLARALVRHRAFDRVRGDEVAPGAGAEGDADVLAGIRRAAISGYHPVGTGRMGPSGDAGAVVDAALRVRGVANLRIADASVMPTIVAGNTLAPVVMIAEKAADLIRGRGVLRAEEGNRGGGGS